MTGSGVEAACNTPAGNPEAHLSIVVVTLAMLTTAQAGPSLAEKVMGLATQPDVTLVPPVGEPSPKIGSFVVTYAPAEGEEPDPAKVGTQDVAPSSCTDALVFKEVDAVEKRSAMWLVNSGVGARIGLPQFGIKIGVDHKSLAGLEYDIEKKLILDTGVAELEKCCVQSPDKCTGEYISEFWRGTGKMWRMDGTDAGLKASLKGLEKLGGIDFSATKGWSAASDWDKPMYFAYRTQAFQLPECKAYMDNMPEKKGRVMFAGVSKRTASEQEARTNARNDARMQVVKYLGEDIKIEGDTIVTSAEALLSGVKDSLTCMDPELETPEGPHYLARVRMYVDKERLDAALSEIKSK